MRFSRYSVSVLASCSRMAKRGGVPGRTHGHLQRVHMVRLTRERRVAPYDRTISDEGRSRLLRLG